MTLVETLLLGTTEERGEREGRVLLLVPSLFTPAWGRAEALQHLG